MHLGIGGALGLIAALGLSLLTGPASAIVPADEPRRDLSDETFLPGCTTPEQMECIEGVDYLLDGQWQSAVGPLTVKTIESDDGNGNIEYGQDLTYFDTPGLLHAEGAGQVAPQLIVSPNINGPEFPAYKVALQPVAVEGDRYQSVDPTGLQRTTYRLRFRTSELQPIFSQMTTVGAITTMEAIAGGLRVSLTGEPGPSQFVKDYAVSDRTDTFDAVSYEWGGFLSDARFADPGGTCVGLGLVTAYSNGNGGQIPQWDRRTGSLSFGTGGYHYGPDGKVYRGRAEVTVPGALARCLWQVDPRQTSRIEIEVFGDGGEEVAGTKSINYDASADVIRMIAIDFTYSEKQIVARPTPIDAKASKQACDPSKIVCVTVDRARKSAKVSLAKVKGVSSVVAVALDGNREDGRTQVTAPVKKGKATLTVKLAGSMSKGQVWVVRTPSTFIGSFQVG